MEIEYVSLLQDFDLMIIIWTDAIANNMGGSIIYINFAINNKNKYKNLNTISNF